MEKSKTLIMKAERVRFYPYGRWTMKPSPRDNAGRGRVDPGISDPLLTTSKLDAVVIVGRNRNCRWMVVRP